MAVITQTHSLRDGPNGAKIGVTANGGDRAELLPDGQAPWAHVTLLDRKGTPQGWLAATSVDNTRDAASPADRAAFLADFVDLCRLHADAFHASTHYVVAVAELRTKTAAGSHPDGSEGPFAFSVAEWQRNCARPELDLPLPPADIGDWRQQVALFASMAASAQVQLSTALGRQPSAVELYLAQIAGIGVARAATPPTKQSMPALLAAHPPTLADGIDPANQTGRDAVFLNAGTDEQVLAAIVAALTPAVDATRPLVEKLHAELISGLEKQLAAAWGPAGQVDTASARIPAGREAMAKLIISKFAAANYGSLQQAAALANAIAESALDPSAEAGGGEHSYGLFQLNNVDGVGIGFSADELKVPDRNIDIMLDHMASMPTADTAFRAALTLGEAVRVFVVEFERPANPQVQIARRLSIAKDLIG